MQFEPEALLLMARRCGLTLRRNGDLLEVRHDQGIPKVWAEALKRHKPDLLPLLPDCQPAKPEGGPAPATRRAAKPRATE